MIKLSQKGQIQIIELNRPKVNAINKELIQELLAQLDQTEKDDSIRGIILTGSDGDKDSEYMQSFWVLFSGLLLRLYSYPKIIFSAISGHSPAGGTVLSIMTDYRIMSRGNFLIGLNEVAVGLSMPIGIGKVFQSLLGERIAEKMTLMGELVNPEKAELIGLVDEIIDSQELLEHTVLTMEKWFKLPPDKQIQSKLSLRKNIINLMKKSANEENDEFLKSWFSDECRLAMKGIINKLSKK